MSDIRFILCPLTSGDSDGLRGLSITAEGIVLTRLMRDESNAPDDFVHVPAATLGFWLADNWWRLRWECRPPGGTNVEWRQAHDMASIGGGYVWPPVTLWSEGQRMAVIARADPPGAVGPVRFLQDALLFVDASAYERAIDGILEQTTQAASGEDGRALKALVDALKAERADPGTAGWRRLEAMAGFDPDSAPPALIERLQSFAARFDPGDVEEAVSAAPGLTAADVLCAAVSDTPAEAFAAVRFADAVVRGHGNGQTAVALPVYPHTSGNEPWRLADIAASQLRKAVGAGDQPLLNRRVAELVDTSPYLLSTRPRDAAQDGPYGLRLGSEGGAGEKVLLRSRWGHDRRFELMRALGDAIWTNLSPLGPISRAGTARQKFQRAFAASLLCPIDGLRSFLDTETPTDGDLSAAARHFHVSERVVRSVLVNKRLMERERLNLTLDDLRGNQPLEDLASAA